MNAGSILYALMVGAPLKVSPKWLQGRMYPTGLRELTQPLTDPPVHGRPRDGLHALDLPRRGDVQLLGEVKEDGDGEEGWGLPLITSALKGGWDP